MDATGVSGLPTTSRAANKFGSDIYLDGVTHREGVLLAVTTDNKEKTFCKTEFSANNGRVACRQLGFNSGGSISSAHAGAGSRMWSTDISDVHFQCLGHEATLPDCPSVQHPPRNCQNTDDVYLTCAEETASKKPITTLPADLGTTKIATTEPASPKPATTGPAETKLVITRPAPTKPVTTRPAPTKPVTTRPTLTKPVTPRPAPTKPGTPRPAPTKPSTPRPAPTKPGTTRPAPTKPVTTRPAPTKPVITRSAPTKPVTTRPAPTKPIITKQGTTGLNATTATGTDASDGGLPVRWIVGVGLSVVILLLFVITIVILRIYRRMNRKSQAVKNKQAETAVKREHGEGAANCTPTSQWTLLNRSPGVGPSVGGSPTSLQGDQACSSAWIYQHELQLDVGTQLVNRPWRVESSPTPTFPANVSTEPVDRLGLDESSPTPTYLRSQPALIDVHESCVPVQVSDDTGGLRLNDRGGRRFSYRDGNVNNQGDNFSSH